MPPYNNSRTASFLLKGAAALFAVLGSFIAYWLVDKAVRYPSVRASQFGSDAPLWIPFALFVAVCTISACYLFVRAARRIDAGEDLYQRRQKLSQGNS